MVCGSRILVLIFEVLTSSLNQTGATPDIATYFLAVLQSRRAERPQPVKHPQGTVKEIVYPMVFISMSKPTKTQEGVSFHSQNLWHDLTSQDKTRLVRELQHAKDFHMESLSPMSRGVNTKCQLTKRHILLCPFLFVFSWIEPEIKQSNHNTTWEAQNGRKSSVKTSLFARQNELSRKVN